MAAQLLNNLGRIGIGLALGASVVNTALYNGIYYNISILQ